MSSNLFSVRANAHAHMEWLVPAAHRFMMYLFWPLFFTFRQFLANPPPPPPPLLFSQPPRLFSTLIFFLFAFLTLKPDNPSDSIRVVVCRFRVEIGTGKKKVAKKRGDGGEKVKNDGGKKKRW